MRSRSSNGASSNQPRPVVASTNPIDGALDVSVLTAVVVDFSEPMNCNSLTTNTFRLNAVPDSYHTRKRHLQR
jgi:hypothetical protein